MTTPSRRLVDSFGRAHNNLRISVTDRCNIRCTYCMPEVVRFLPRSELLTFEEITRFVRVTASFGVDKIRLTGGEPLVRRDLPKLVASIVEVPGIADVGLTTNGLLLEPLARPLKDAGLGRINVSLDTMDPGRFRELTRRDGWERVIEGILAAKSAGFDPIKLNAIAIKGSTEADVVPLARFAREHGLELRFIEYMPLDVDGHWDRDKVLTAGEILDRLADEFGPLTPALGQDPRAPSVDYNYPDGGRVGLIASVTRPFCGRCNRLRLTADGKLRNCLFALDESDLRPILRQDKPNDDDLGRALLASVAGKWAGHEVNSASFIKPERLMHAIGG